MSKFEFVPSQPLTGENGEYFFGYYDVPAYSADERYHLVHRSAFRGRIPEADDRTEIGIIDRQTGRYSALAETTAWNFQQGAMLQWHPQSPNEEILYNVRDKDGCRGVILNIRTGQSRQLERPIANVSPDGRFALGISFARMFDFRPGYGYAGLTEPERNEPAPDNDGVYRIDLETGKAELILSLAQIGEVVRPWLGEPRKLLINHLTINRDGSRFVMLVRYFPEPGQMWGTVVMTADRDGGSLHTLTDGFTVASHYHWKSPDVLMIYANGPAGLQLYEWTDDKTPEKRIVDLGYFRSDGHCSYSPDGNWLLYDSYPDSNRMQHLYLYHLPSKKGMTLGSYYSEKADIDARCDLHPRWSPSGNRISFDSTHEGRRRVYEMDLTDVINNW